MRRVTTEAQTPSSCRLHVHSPVMDRYRGWMPGEAMHLKGADGARRAKRWLDATTRTKASWTNEDAVAAARMEFSWPSGGGHPFSFDVGGILAGEPFENHAFLAEVKNYTGDDLGPDYDDFVAKAYLVRRDHERVADQFMFLSWHPFRVGTWMKHTSVPAIIHGLAKNHHRAFPADDAAQACFPERLKLSDLDNLLPCRHMDQLVLSDLAERMWNIVLTEKQEQLVISQEDLKMVIAERTARSMQ